MIIDGVLRGTNHPGGQQIPGFSAPSGLGTSISVSSVRLPGCNAVAIRVTLPGKVRSGISGTRTTASIPGCSPNAASCGTNTWVRITLLCVIVNMNVPLVASACTRQHGHPSLHPLPEKFLPLPGYAL